ncbi:MAG: 7-carboxy-7-deazaguanine synthase [Syntrophus sp. SKADARSKE-3]|nr:7-carboxy-7-deazaguanine synthase [Syntrophus sp. SKADARSKE-3]
MKIGGFLPFSLIDYPGCISAVIFTQGCNFRCPYCHNPELVDPMQFNQCLNEDTVLSFLEKRRGRLDGVTITGGEPMIHKDLPSLIREIKKMGFAVKVDTNGSNPEILHELIVEKLIDFVAMDIKGPLEKYSWVAGVPVDLKNIRRSIEIVMNAPISSEFRTTVVSALLDEADLQQVTELIKGTRSYVLQPFQPSKTLNQRFLKLEPTGEEWMEVLKGVLAQDLAIHIR